jgi:hypothetical protein
VQAAFADSRRDYATDGAVGPRAISDCHPSEGGELKTNRTYGLSVYGFYFETLPSLG